MAMVKRATLASWAMVLGGLVLVEGNARAQEELPAAPAETPPPPEEKEPEAMLADETPDAEKPARSAEAVARMREILSQVLAHLANARDERDVVKLNCVNEKLTAVKALLRISEKADVTMQEALARRDGEVGAHEFEKIHIALRKCEQLLVESEACIGELAIYAGETEVKVEITGVPDEDPTEIVGNEDFIFDRPPAASPYQ